MVADPEQAQPRLLCAYSVASAGRMAHDGIAAAATDARQLDRGRERRAGDEEPSAAIVAIPGGSIALCMQKLMIASGALILGSLYPWIWTLVK